MPRMSFSFLPSQYLPLTPAPRLPARSASWISFQTNCLFSNAAAGLTPGLRDLHLRQWATLARALPLTARGLGQNPWGRKIGKGGCLSTGSGRLRARVHIPVPPLALRPLGGSLNLPGPVSSSDTICQITRHSTRLLMGLGHVFNKSPLSRHNFAPGKAACASTHPRMHTHTHTHSQRKMPECRPGSTQVLYLLHEQVYGLTSNRRTEDRVAQQGAGSDRGGS